MMQCLLKVYVIAITANQVCGRFTVNTALQNIVFMDTADDSVPDDVHSEYFFGKCKARNKKLVFKETKKYEDLKGKLIVSGWLHGKSSYMSKTSARKPLPRCVYVRARSSYGDLVRYHAFKFNICVGLIIYNYANGLYEFTFYEWYLPVEVKERIDWELFFYE